MKHLKALAYTLLILSLIFLLLLLIFIYPKIVAVFITVAFTLGVYVIIYKHLKGEL
jgi:hypothetical protein